MIEWEGDGDHFVIWHCQRCKECYSSWIKRDYEYITADEISQISKISYCHCTRKQRIG